MGKIFLWLFLALILAGAAAILDGQDMTGRLPDAPKPSFPRLQWPLLAADASIRALDCYSTGRSLSQGNREMFLPHAIAGHPAAMAAYSAGAVGADWLASRWLIRHNHPRLAAWMTVADIGQVTPWVVRNLIISQKRLDNTAATVFSPSIPIPKPY